MQIGIALPQYGTHAQAGRVASFARDAEAAGFDSLWVSDRSLTPVEPSDAYRSYRDWPVLAKPRQTGFVIR